MSHTGNQSRREDEPRLAGRAALAEAKRDIDQLDRAVRTLARRKPLATSLVALGVGFLLGRFVSRL